jgi:serine/threonine protein kinase
MPSERGSLIHMAEGVRYIHSKDLVHRDIKPENVLIYVKDEVLLKISDFGCSKRSREGMFSMSSQISGTTYYMAPEILEVINSDERLSDVKMTNASDVFALGCTFFMFLTRGTHPFGQGFSIAPNILEGKSDLQSRLALIQFNCNFVHDTRVSIEELPRNHFAYKLIEKMIDQSPDRRPPITEICEALAVRRMSIFTLNYLS